MSTTQTEHLTNKTHLGPSFQIRRDGDPLKQDPTVKRYLRHKRPTTQSNALRHIHLLTSYTKQTPIQFIQWAETQKGITIDDTIEQTADEYKLSVSTRRNFASYIRGLLKANGINNLPTNENQYTEQNITRPLYKDEIRRIIGQLTLGTDLRTKRSP